MTHGQFQLFMGLFIALFFVATCGVVALLDLKKSKK